MLREDEFADLCARARAVGLEAVLADPGHRSAVDAAIATATAEIERRRLRHLARALEGGTLATRDMDLDAMLLHAVRLPRIRLDAVGAFVIAGWSPGASAR